MRNYRCDPCGSTVQFTRLRVLVREVGDAIQTKALCPRCSSRFPGEKQYQPTEPPAPALPIRLGGGAGAE